MLLPVLILQLASGYFIARSGLGIRERWVAAVTGCPIAFLLFGFVLNGSLRLGLGWNVASALGLSFLVLLGFLARLRPAEPASCWKVALQRWEPPLLWAVAALLWACTCAGQLFAPDDDYWLHSPLQRILLDTAEFPPRNPYLEEYVLHGHFIRDLWIAFLAKAAGITVLRSQWLVTSTCHVLAWLTWFVLARRPAPHPAPAWCSLGMLFWGANAMHKSGLGEFFHNNTSLVYLTLAVCLHLAALLWERPGFWGALLLGLLGGHYAQLYETHFGLFWLTLVTSVVICRPASFRHCALAATLAALVALTQGGALTELTTRTRTHAPSEANQSQQVQLSFPKQPFMNLKVGVREIQPLSCAYGPFRRVLLLLDGPAQRTDENYVPLWSWTVLRMHWLPLYLAPLSLWGALRARSPVPLWMWLFGAWAYLVPGLVHFGPIHEAEYLRWQFAAGFGLAGALGWSLGALLSAPGWSLPLLGSLVLALCLVCGLNRQGLLLHKVWAEGPLRASFLALSEWDWLLRHKSPLRVTPSDIPAMQALEKAAPPGSRVLMNGNQGDPWGIHFNSTVTMMTGCRVTGHALPGHDHPVGLPPFRWNELAQKFMEEPDPALARTLRADFLYLRGAPADWRARLEKQVPLKVIFADENVQVYAL